MSTFNFRYAQQQGQDVAAPFAFKNPANQIAQSPGVFNNAQQSNTPIMAPQQPSMPANNAQQQSAQELAAKQQEDYKQTLLTWFNTIMDAKQAIINIGRSGIALSRSQAINQFVKNDLPSLLRFDILENWATNALAKRYDVIFNNLKSTNLGKVVTNPEIQELAQELSNQMTRSIGRKLGTNGQQYLEFMQKLKAAKTSRPFNVLNTASKLDDLVKQIDVLLPTVGNDNTATFQKLKDTLIKQKENLLNSTETKSVAASLDEIDNFIKSQKYIINRVDPKAGANILRTLEYEAKPVNQAVQLAAKLGENPTAGRKAAVESINIFKSAVMKIPALRGLASALEFVGKNMPIIDMLLSSADYAQFIYEINQGKVKIDDPEHPEYIPLFIFSSFKMLLSISMVVAPPLIPILLPFDVAVSALQLGAIPAAQELGYIAGAGWGGKEKINEMNRISEQAIGTPPSNPDAKIVYDWIIMKGFKESITQIVLKNPNGNWNTFGNKWVKDAIKNFFDNAEDYYVDKAHTKILGGDKSLLNLGLASSWLKNTNDTRYQELNQSLLGLAMNVVKAAKQEANKPKSNLPKEIWNPPWPNRKPNSNKVYNNRRYITCPST